MLTGRIMIYTGQYYNASEHRCYLLCSDDIFQGDLLLSLLHIIGTSRCDNIIRTYFNISTRIYDKNAHVCVCVCVCVINISKLSLWPL